MPLYEYECSACKNRFELIQKFSDEPAKVCVRCGGPVIRLLSSPAIQFKGTGWYVTDYAGKNTVSAENRKENGDKVTSSSDGDKTSKDSTPSSTGTAKT